VSCVEKTFRLQTTRRGSQTSKRHMHTGLAQSQCGNRVRCQPRRRGPIVAIRSIAVSFNRRPSGSARLQARKRTEPTTRSRTKPNAKSRHEAEPLHRYTAWPSEPDRRNKVTSPGARSNDKTGYDLLRCVPRTCGGSWQQKAALYCPVQAPSRGTGVAQRRATKSTMLRLRRVASTPSRRRISDPHRPLHDSRDVI
jgi:hypothetical protein